MINRRSLLGMLISIPFLGVKRSTQTTIQRLPPLPKLGSPYSYRSKVVVLKLVSTTYTDSGQIVYSFEGDKV